MEESEKKSNKGAGCITIPILLGICWGLPSLIRGKGFLNGIQSNIEAGISLGVIALIGYALFKIFIDK
ncbi:hypothetical protein [Mesonia sp.]|uniref:hypothetical protein n=1 Tax=Mesonia sp. TaxID=1960830 RepID=UPI003F99B176